MAKYCITLGVTHLKQIFQVDRIFHKSLACFPFFLNMEPPYSDTPRGRFGLEPLLIGSDSHKKKHIILKFFSDKFRNN